MAKDAAENVVYVARHCGLSSCVRAGEERTELCDACDSPASTTRNPLLQERP